MCHNLSYFCLFTLSGWTKERNVHNTRKSKALIMKHQTYRLSQTASHRQVANRQENGQKNRHEKGKLTEKETSMHSHCIYTPKYPSIHPSTPPPTHPYLVLSVCLLNYLSIYLSIKYVSSSSSIYTTGGRLGMSDVSPLSGISGLSFDSTLLAI